MTVQTVIDNTTQKSERGRKHVEAKLIQSACTLMAELGPRAVTIRDIAADAGVNHGQIHHYFGGKKGLLTAAIRHLAIEHAEHAAKRGLDDIDAPPPLTLGRDRRYLLSVVRSVLDGEMDLATLDIDENLSVPRRVLETITDSLGYDEPTVEVKAALALAMAVEQGWAALEQYIVITAGVKPEEIDAVRQLVGKASREPLRKLKRKD